MKWHDEQVGRQIVIMGSGETSPTMVTPHQTIINGLQGKKRLLLDTPFGFQENADILTDRLCEYFAQSVGFPVTPVTLRRADAAAGVVAEAVAAIRSADWIFAGPGSPTYALNVWRETGLAPHLDQVLTRGTLVLASAAALTAGTHTIAVYEIYKVGTDPYSLPGMNVLGRHTGLNAMVVPHFDNAEGGNHDTRFCYMGERRLRILEAQLPPEVFILGVDEHTGVSFDLDTRTASVFGRGYLSVRRGQSTWQLKSGQSTSFDEIATQGGVPRELPTDDIQVPVVASQVEDLMEQGDVLSAVDALLELDDLNRDVQTRATVHALIMRLGQLAASPKVDIATVVGPYIEALLQARSAARTGGRWDEADAIRDRLTSLHVEIKDSSAGSSWEIDQSSQS
ncbi:MAG: hypothetical protein F2839_02775 [Actinobacteria bacterium]|uniref:Unannotated protein n=1 Tax=freshwater metagenome TaxID=449393 RepID=A0A6J5Z236_9ZZZZ|nr:hypothetical protein [Actinomycetota bacterium]